MPPNKMLPPVPASTTSLPAVPATIDVPLGACAETGNALDLHRLAGAGNRLTDVGQAHIVGIRQAADADIERPAHHIISRLAVFKTQNMAELVLDHGQ